MLSRYATVCLFNSSTLYQKQQYYCCSPDTDVNTTVGRCVGASFCCVVQYVRVYGVRYFFSAAACAGSIAGFDIMDSAGAECIPVL